MRRFVTPYATGPAARPSDFGASRSIRSPTPHTSPIASRMTVELTTERLEMGMAAFMPQIQGLSYVV